MSIRILSFRLATAQDAMHKATPRSCANWGGQSKRLLMW